MRQITLSDHTADMINEAEQARRKTWEAQMEAYREKVATRDAKIEARRQQRREAWRNRRILAAIGHGIATLWEKATDWPVEPRMQGQTEREHIWKVGNQGETLVAKFFAGHLSDDWVLFHGYHNPMGEIDQVLLGPGGLFTIEIKHINGEVHVHGDQWSRDKYDNYGNLVETGLPIRDRKGRSPSDQVSQSTQRMLSFIHKSLPEIRAWPIVVLSHERGSIGQVVDPTVSVFRLHKNNLADHVQQHQNLLDEQAREKLAALIQRDHRYHAQRRGKQGKSSGHGPRQRHQNPRKQNTSRN